jgi:hypothetical protein
MDSDQDLLDAYDAREDARKAAEWEQKREAQEWCENAAKQAHKHRNVWRLINNLQVLNWEEMCATSQSDLISDVRNVAEHPSITAAELLQMYKERLIARGDTDNPDLRVGSEDTPLYMDIEDAVLKHLKECLADPSNPPPESITRLS